MKGRKMPFQIQRGKSPFVSNRRHFQIYYLLLLQWLLNPTAQVVVVAFQSTRLVTKPLPKRTSGRPSWKNRRRILPNSKVQNYIFRRLDNPRTAKTAYPITSTMLSSSWSSWMMNPSQLFLTRMVFLRAMAFVYAIAFIVALRQNKALIGDHGITPARHVLDQAQMIGKQKREQRLQWRQNNGDTRPAVPFDNPLDKSRIFAMPLLKLPYLGWKQFIKSLFYVRRSIGRTVDRIPVLTYLREIWWDRSDRQGRPITTLLWWANNRNNLNPWLDSMAIGGIIISTFMLLTGVANVPLVFSLWLLHRSIMNVGGPWYGFGWEPQLGEVGFHAMFMVPLLSMQYPIATPVHPAVAWCVRWHLFRIMIGAGLIKFRSNDRKWKDLTAMNYFYETQPVPNPLSRYFHWMPTSWHKFEVLTNHFVECVAPWVLVLPGVPSNIRCSGALLQMIFQLVLISSGNLSFLNWLTMVPAIMCMDDSFLKQFLPLSTVQAFNYAGRSISFSFARQLVSFGFLAIVLWLSIPVVRNLCSKRQIMNGSFDPLRLINTYGAFGTVNEVRDEYIISSAVNWDGPWREYQFKVKPGDVQRSPRFISPYHYRLDWQMWVAVQQQGQTSWLFPFLIQLLEQNEDLLNNLMEGDPWADTPDTPKYIRIDQYRYKFHKRRKGEVDPPYWEREFVKKVYPRQGLATIDTLRDELFR